MVKFGDGVVSRFRVEKGSFDKYFTIEYPVVIVDGLLQNDLKEAVTTAYLNCDDSSKVIFVKEFKSHRAALGKVKSCRKFLRELR